MQDNFQQIEVLNQKVTLFRQIVQNKLHAKSAYLRQLQDYARRQ